jgi:hypothetical protein
MWLAWNWMGSGLGTSRRMGRSTGCRWRTRGRRGSRRCRRPAGTGLGRASGISRVVVDCRPVERRPERDVAKFEATRRACELLGWEFRLVGTPDPVVTANLRWLAGYRHPGHSVAGLVQALQAAFAEPMPLLLWRQDLAADLSVPLHPCASVTTAAASLLRPDGRGREDGLASG